MKKIAFVSGDIFRTGGTERVATLIANKLSEKYKIYIISYGLEKKSYFYLNSNVEIINLFDRKNKVLNKLSSIIKLRKVVKKYNIDFLVDVDIILSINSLIATSKLKTKVISWEHFNFYSDLNIKRRGLARKLAAIYSNHIVTLTEQDKNQYLDNLKLKAKIDYIYNPSPYPKVKKSKCEKKIAIAVGRLTHQKGFDKLLDIWSEIEQKDDEWKLIIVGSGEEKNKLYNQISNLKIKRVEIIEHTKNIEYYYEIASLYLMTSRYEGLPMTLIESQSFGLPIISYDIKTGPRDIILNSKNGYLIENNNKKDFVDKFFELSKDFSKIKSFSEKAYINSKVFNIENIIKKWEIIFK